MSVALPVFSRPTATGRSHQPEARWVLNALYLTALIVGLLSGHPVTSVLLGAAVLTQIFIRRHVQPTATGPVETAKPGT
jgi:4-hydroxybenzoate polyprenyltransferase